MQNAMLKTEEPGKTRRYFLGGLKDKIFINDESFKQGTVVLRNLYAESTLPE